MFTPQQIEQISFSQAKFNGYDKRAVDEFLEPLTEDYITLYKENALLKSKMRVLVSKLEEYRANEASMKEAIANAQKACDTMVKDAEDKCTQMLNDANVTATENANVLIEAENERLEEARRVTAEKILSIETQLKDALELLSMIRKDNSPEKPAKAENAAADMADEIAHNLENLVGRADNTAPTAEPKHPVSDTSSKFANLQFGRNYDPLKK